MIYSKLIWAFMKIGILGFGGGLAIISLIRDSISEFTDMSSETFANIVAIAQVTPGPVAINTATYVGALKGGILGSAVATFAVALPAFVIILLIMIVFKKLLKSRIFNFTLSSLKSSVIGIIFATGVIMSYENILFGSNEAGFDLRALILFVLLVAVYFIPRAYKKKISSILLIGLSAVFGAVIYAI